MKKIIMMITILLITLPSITILIIKPKDKILTKYNFEKNLQVRVLRTSTNTIEKIPLEKYLVGVIAGEMPTNYEKEALKAQAVAARTYTIRKIKINKDKDYDLVDTTNDQVYIDPDTLKNNWQESYEERMNKLKDAVSETTGEYLTYNGEIIQAFFFSTSSGNTENCKDVFGSDLPYLVSVSSNWDSNSPSYLGNTTLTKQEFYEKLGLQYEEELNIQLEKNNTNSINTIIINNNRLKGTDFRFKLGLKSTNFEITEQDNNIIINTKGYGHGVGMSQYGALELAKKGYKYDDILKYYYQGIELKKI